MLHRRKGEWMPLQYIQAVHKVQKSLVAAFELTIAACGFKINSCAARGVKKFGQHCGLSDYVTIKSARDEGRRVRLDWRNN